MVPIVCASAIEALDIIMNDRFPLTLGMIDICMPGTSGIQLAEQIKNEKPFFPMIALSSSNEYIDMTNFEFRVQKPIIKQQLLNIIVKVVLNYRSRSTFIVDDSKSRLLNLHKKRKSNLMNTRGRPPTPKSGYKILIAEDVDYSATLLNTMLNSLGYTNIDVAVDGLHAISMLRKNKAYNIIFLDLKMPKADGYAVMDYIKRHEYDISIVIVSASVLEQEKAKCIENGARYFICKPIQINYLRDVITQITCS